MMGKIKQRMVKAGKETKQINGRGEDCRGGKQAGSKQGRLDNKDNRKDNTKDGRGKAENKANGTEGGGMNMAGEAGRVAAGEGYVTPSSASLTRELETGL